jgi:hypothetical protein
MGRAAILFIVALALSACQGVKSDPAATAANRAAYDQIRTGQDAAITAQLGAGANAAATQAMLAKIRSLVPATPPVKSTVVASNTATSPAGRAHVETIEYDYRDRTARFETPLIEPKGTHGWKLRSFRIVVASHKELAPNTLSLANRSPGQLAFFGLAITSPLLMVAALIKVLRTPGLTYRWLWCAFALVGLFSFQMNWANGVMLVQWMALQIIGFWIAKGPSAFQPWMIGATVPIGALLILSGVVAKRPKAG